MVVFNVDEAKLDFDIILYTMSITFWDLFVTEFNHKVKWNKFYNVIDYNPMLAITLIWSFIGRAAATG